MRSTRAAAVALCAFFFLLTVAAKLEASRKTQKAAEPPQSEWQHFESDLWYIVKPLKGIFYVTCLGVLGAIGILRPIVSVAWNLVAIFFKMMNKSFCNVLSPLFTTVVTLTVKLLTILKIPLEFILRLFIEPFCRHVVTPLWVHFWAHYDFVIDLTLIAAGSAGICWGLLDTPETPWLAGMKPMSRFDGLIACVESRPPMPSTNINQVDLILKAAEHSSYFHGCFLKNEDAALAGGAILAGVLTVSFGLAMTYRTIGLPLPEFFEALMFLPWRVIALALAAMLGPFGAVVAAQACARVVAVDLGLDTMYNQLFKYDPNENSIAQMELAGTVEMAIGLGLVSVALRFLAIAFLNNQGRFSTPGSAHESMACGVFWEYLPLVRAGLAARIGASLCKVGIAGLGVGERTEHPTLHIGFLTALGMGICMSARAVSILGKYFNQALLSRCLGYTWRPVLAMQFGAYATLFARVAVQAVEAQPAHNPMHAILFALCTASMLAVTLLTAATPAFAWKLGDVLLCYLDAGLFSAIRLLGSLLQQCVLEPLLEYLFLPAVYFMWGCLSLILSKSYHIAFFLFSISFGLLLRPLVNVLVFLYSNPFTGLPASGGLLYGMFQIYKGAIVIPAFLQPMVWLWFAYEHAVLAMSFVVQHAGLALKIPMAFTGKQVGLAMTYVGLQPAWIPNMPAVLDGEVFSDLQFAFRVYAIMLLVSLLWRYALERKPENFYALFSDLKVPDAAALNPTLKQSLTDLTRNRPIGNVSNEIAKNEGKETTEKGKKVKENKNQ